MSEIFVVVVRGARTNSDLQPAGVQVKVLFAKLVTFITALEPALLAPLFLMMLGLDTYASLTSVRMTPIHILALHSALNCYKQVTMLVLSTVSQIPKRFSFRARPCVLGAFPV